METLSFRELVSKLEAEIGQVNKTHYDGWQPWATGGGAPK